MSLKKINTLLTAVFILFILWFGTEYIVRPEAVASGYGLPDWPSGDGGGFLVVKGVRDVVMALVLGVLLLTAQRRALGWVLLVEAFAAYGDMGNVLAHHGSVATALGVHGLTATLMAATGLMTIYEVRKATAVPVGLAAVPA